MITKPSSSELLLNMKVLLFSTKTEISTLFKFGQLPHLPSKIYEPFAPDVKMLHLAFI